MPVAPGSARCTWRGQACAQLRLVTCPPVARPRHCSRSVRISQHPGTARIVAPLSTRTVLSVRNTATTCVGSCTPAATGWQACRLNSAHTTRNSCPPGSSSRHVTSSVASLLLLPSLSCNCRLRSDPSGPVCQLHGPLGPAPSRTERSRDLYTRGKIT